MQLQSARVSCCMQSHDDAVTSSCTRLTCILYCTCDFSIQCCRLCPKKTVVSSRASEESSKLALYGSSEEFTTALDAWSLKYKSMQSVRDETPAQTVLRLSEKLCNNKTLLEVSII
jgi:hypothetical protein